MKAKIISVGDELLIGKTVNTNLTLISKELRSIGIEVNSASSVKDQEEAIFKTLKNSDESLVIFTGGLGPTRDDITKETVCKYYNLDLELNHETLTRIKNFFAKQNREMKDTNKKQAYFPKNAIVLSNNYGTAPGAIIQVDGKTIVMLPGPPSELIPMFRFVKDYLIERSDTTIYQSGYLVAGIGESEMESKMDCVYEKHPEVQIAPYADIASIQYIFTSSNSKALERALDHFRKLFSEYIVGPYDKTLETRVVETLMAQNKTISFAESCTGGLLAAYLVNVPNVSKVFNESYVLYSNGSKIKQLGINQMIIDKFGAVSKQCVYELAYQLAQRTDTDIVLSVSGIAGPSGGTAVKPVGTVYFGLHHEGKTKTYSKIFAGDRNLIRKKATIYGLYLVLKALLHEDHHS